MIDVCGFLISDWPQHSKIKNHQSSINARVKPKAGDWGRSATG
jgi:hypothetical protein